MTDEIVVIDSEEEENVVDNGTSYVSEETAEIAEQAAADAKRWAQESERQAEIATSDAEAALEAKQYVQTTIGDNLEDIQNAAENAQKAKDWAIKMDGKIDGEDYSSKYYARQASSAFNTCANRDLSNLSSTGQAKFDAKQNVIEDLSTIRSNALLGANAVQPSQLASVAFSGSYGALRNKPSIPTKTSDLANDSGFVTSSQVPLLGSSNTFTGAINTFTGNVSVPDVDQIAAPSQYAANTKYVHDYVGTGVLHLYSYGSERGRFSANATSDVTIDLNIPTRVAQLTDAAAYATRVWVSATYATKTYVDNADSNLQSQIDAISIPTVNNATLTITQGGVSKGTFTANASSDVTIALDAGGGSAYTAGTGIDITSNVISVKSPVLKNKSTVGLTIEGKATEYNAINIGLFSKATYIGAVSYGVSAEATALNTTAIGSYSNASVENATALGSAAVVSVDKATGIGSGVSNSGKGSIALGYHATNTETGVFVVALTSSNNTTTSYTLLGVDGYIPNARINMDSTPTSASTNTVTSGGVYTALSGKADTSSLATVATTGAYSDLSGTPTIPTVNNATLTITQGGVSKGTFTANASSDVTIELDAGGGSGDVESVNGYTGVVVLTASDVGALPDDTVIPTDTSDLTNDAGFITSADLSGYATESWVSNQGYITGITSSDVTTALGYTPYNSTNPSGYITSAALSGYATETWVGNQGYITGITSSDVTTALGYTPYDASNPSGYTSNVGTVTSVNNVSPVSGNVTISIPTDTSDLTNGAGYITSSALSPYVLSSSLATVATSGSYNDLSNKPTIPTVNNATLTIQKNGTTVNTFTANASSNVTANITVPTKVSDLTNDSGYITGITSSDVTTALGYTPYNSSNPNGYTSNVGTVTSVNNVSPVSGNVTLAIPTVNNATLTITQGGVSKGTFTANASSDVTIALDAGGGGGTTYTAGTGIDITSNVISVDGLQTSEVTLATVATTGAYSDLSGTPSLSGYQTTSNLVTSISSSSTNTQYPSAKCVYDIIGDVETLLSQV